jgi:hypothetical protein
MAMGLDSLGSTVERIGGKNVRKHFDRGVKELDGVVNSELSFSLFLIERSGVLMSA